MKNFEEVEKELNKYPDPTNFHDMSVINMEITENQIKIRFCLAHYVDLFNITDNDEQFAIIEVIYNGVKINIMDMNELLEIRDVEVFNLSENQKGQMELNLLPDSYSIFFNFVFSYKTYKWKVIDVVPSDDIYSYGKNYCAYIDRCELCRTNKMPAWSQFGDEIEVDY